MSEYQYVAFQAVDRPLNDEQLAFAQRQSSRAKVTRHSLTVEYHYGSFRGDVDGLLLRGYDVCLQYTNYGYREIRWRLPSKLPFASTISDKYVDDEVLTWKSCAQEGGGILALRPYQEGGNLDPAPDTQACLDAAIQVRERLLSGDLRALHILWLCAATDDRSDPNEIAKPPVPHGIAETAAYGDDLLWFFGLDPLLLRAVGEGVDGAPPDNSADHAARWIKALSAASAKNLLLRFLKGDPASEKNSLLATIRDERFPHGWPTSDKRRTFAELL